MNTTFTKTISIKDVYGTDNPEIPKGYKALEFRLANRGEHYFYGRCVLRAGDDHQDSPYIILSKLPDPVVIKGNVENTFQSTITVAEIYGDDVLIPEGYEFVDFRVPVDGEYYCSNNLGKVDLATSLYYYRDDDPRKFSRIILRKVTL